MTTIIKMRAPGMTMFRLPMTIWAMFITAILQLLALPVLTGALIMQLFDRDLGTTFFLPDRAHRLRTAADERRRRPAAPVAAPVLVLRHPAVYIMILPAMGMVSDILPASARKPLFGYKPMVYSIAGIAGLGFIVWGHHMFLTGMNPVLGTTFMISTMMIALPSAIKTFNWLGTIWGGNIQFTTPMLLRALVRVDVHHRRAVGHLHGRHAGRHLHPRHLLHRRPHPLRALRRHALRRLRRHLLLVPEDVRPDDERDAGARSTSAHVHLLQLRLLPDAHPGHARACRAASTTTRSTRSSRTCSR